MKEVSSASTGSLSLFLTGGLMVAGWKVVSLMLASSGSGTSPGLDAVKVLLAVVGLIFVGCGLVVLRRKPGRDTMLFAGFCLCAGLHWGGPLELPAGDLRTGLLFFYLLISSLLGEALFLHFALSFPRETRAAGSKVVRALLYGPVVGGIVLAVLAVRASEASAVQVASQNGFLVLHTVVSNLFPALVLVLYVIHLLRQGLPRAEKPFVGLMVIGMLVAWSPYLVASAAGWETDSWNLAMVALPIAFAIAILAIKRIRESGAAVV
jgi:hypothetical protein